jgi:hypothetical protein
MSGSAAQQVEQDELPGESAAQETTHDNAAHESAAHEDAAHGGFAPELHRLLKVLSTLFLDNVHHLEETVSQVTDLITRNGLPDKELIVALQSFDRLKQEFEALGGALAHYADAAKGPLTGEALAQFGRQVIGTIALADLRMRLLDKLQPTAPSIALSDPPAEEIDIDVVF